MMPVFERDGWEILTFLLDGEQGAIRDIGACLDEHERCRARTLRLERDRCRFVATRGQLRRVLASRLEISPSDVELEYGPLGKPRLSHRMPSRDLHFSVSRSEDVAAIAVSNRRDIGIDIEAMRPVPEADEIASLSFSSVEYGSYLALSPQDRLLGFLLRWTRLEAISKAVGCGLGQSHAWDETDWAAHSLVPRPGYVGTMAVRN